MASPPAAVNFEGQEGAGPKKPKSAKAKAKGRGPERLYEEGETTLIPYEDPEWPPESRGHH